LGEERRKSGGGDEGEKQGLHALDLERDKDSS
jgi:hypothetical protein